MFSFSISRSLAFSAAMDKIILILNYLIRLKDLDSKEIGGYNHNPMLKKDLLHISQGKPF
jgi:hypothetical protein